MPLGQAGSIGANHAACSGRYFSSEETEHSSATKPGQNRTVVLIPGGILEEHGPYLPSITDGYWNEKLTDTIAKSLSASRWQVIIFPTIPLGNSGANDIGGKFSFPGTYTLQFETLRNYFYGSARRIRRTGLPAHFYYPLSWAPNHQRALDQAANFLTIPIVARWLT